MHLSVRKNNGIPCLFLLESVYSPGSQRSTKRSVRLLGRYEEMPDEVKRIYEDQAERRRFADTCEKVHNSRIGRGVREPVTLLEKKTDRLDFLKEALREHAAAPDKKQEEQNEPDSGTGLRQGEDILLRYGHLALRNIWAEDLGLAYKVGYLQSSKTEIESWHLNDLLFYLCSLLSIDPESYPQAYENKHGFLYCPWANITRDNFGRGLDFVCKFRKELFNHAAGKHKENCPDIDIVIFEGTTDHGTPDDTGPVRQAVTVTLALAPGGFPVECVVSEGYAEELGTVDAIRDIRDRYATRSVWFQSDKTSRRPAFINDVVSFMGKRLSVITKLACTRERMAAHCILCTISLMMLRILQDKLAATGVTMSPDRICKALHSAVVRTVPDKNGVHAFARSGTEMMQSHAARLSKENAVPGTGINDTEDLETAAKTFVAGVTIHASDLDQVLTAAGFGPLKYQSTMPSIKRHFGMHALPNDRMVSPVVSEYARYLSGLSD